MRRILILLSTMICLLITGCSNGPKSVDNNFVSDIAKATKARWDYLDTTKEESENLYLKEAVQKELDVLLKYTELNEEEEIFNDPKLKKIAEDYISALNTQINALKYYNSDFIKYSEEWAEGYNLRSTLLVQLVDEYGAKIDEDSLSELRDNAQAVEEKEDLDKEVQELIKTINFEKVKTEYDWSDYQAIVENTTSVDLESLELNVKLLDKDGVTISDEIIWVDNWNKGEKKKLEFTTDQKFSEIKWDLGDYYTK